MRVRYNDFEDYELDDARAMRRRLLKYILPVIFLSLAFNVPKFFEATIAYDEVRMGNGTSNLTTGQNYSAGEVSKFIILA